MSKMQEEDNDQKTQMPSGSYWAYWAWADPAQILIMKLHFAKYLTENKNKYVSKL